jgi:hypothetical protein
VQYVIVWPHLYCSVFLSFVVFLLVIFQGSFNQHKMFLPEGMDYNKVLKSLSKELKQAEV